MTMYDTFISAIQAGGFDLPAMLRKIDEYYIRGEIDADQRDELQEEARTRARGEQTYDVTSEIEALWAAVRALQELHADDAANTPSDEARPYTQPTGAHDAYQIGDVVSYNGKTGYIKADYVRVTPETATASTDGTVTGSDVRLRLGPGMDYSIVKTYPKGTAVKISGSSGNWYEVSINGKYGYMSKDYVQASSSSSTSKTDSVPTPKQSMNETGIITGTSVRMRSGPGTSYATIGYFSTGTKMSITGKTDNWYAVTYNNQKGYVSCDYLKISTSSNQASQIIATAKEYLGVPYVYGGTSPKGFDCSGLIYYVFKQYGYSLYRCADDMYYHDGTNVEKANLQPGDLVFFSSSSEAVGHVGMYIGNGQFIHASSGSGKVVITELEGCSYYITHYVGAKRIL